MKARATDRRRRRRIGSGLNAVPFFERFDHGLQAVSLNRALTQFEPVVLVPDCGHGPSPLVLPPFRHT